MKRKSIADKPVVTIYFYRDVCPYNTREDRCIIKNIDIFTRSKGVISPDKIQIGKHTLEVKEEVREEFLFMLTRSRKQDVELEDLSDYMENVAI